MLFTRYNCILSFIDKIKSPLINKFSRHKNFNLYKQLGDLNVEETMLKIKFYIISILILLVLVVFIDIKLFDSNGAYLDLCELICCNWFSIISIVFIIMGFIFLLLQNHELNGAANPCCRIIKIENVNL